MAICCLPPHASASAQSAERGFRIDMKNTDPQEQFDIAVLMKELVKTVELYAKNEKKAATLSIPCKILFSKDRKAGKPETVLLKNRTVLIYAPTRYSALCRYDTLSAMASVMLLCKCGITPDISDNAPIPEWMSTAVVKKILRRIDKSVIPGIYIYSGIHAMVLANPGKSMFSELMNHSLKPEDGEAFNVYTEACEILLESCFRYSSKKDNIISQMIYFSAQKKCAPEEAFKMTVGTFIIQENAAFGLPPGRENRELTEDKKISLWFAKELRTAALNYFLPADASSAENIFNSALNVDYMEKAKDENASEAKPKTCSLSQLGKNMKSIKNPNILLTGIQTLFAQMKTSFPPLLHPPLDKMETALSSLKANDVDDFETMEKEAEEDFKKALIKQNKLEKYLKSIEISSVPPAMIYERMLNTLSSRKRNTAYWGPVEKYLDEIEAQYER